MPRDRAVPAFGSSIGYSLAEVGGIMSVRTPVSTSWPKAAGTADARVGTQIGGTSGGTFGGGTGATPS